MVDSSELVKVFHRKFGYPIGLKLSECVIEKNVQDLLQHSALQLGTLSTELRRSSVADDTLVYRMYVLIEEVGELAEALLCRNEEETADACANVRYSIDSVAVAFGYPIAALVAEVHRSNMTKEYGKTRAFKGPSYSKPDIRRILEEYKTI